MAAKSHREKVEEFNKYLSQLSEHYDIPKVLFILLYSRILTLTRWGLVELTMCGFIYKEYIILYKDYHVFAWHNSAVPRNNQWSLDLYDFKSTAVMKLLE